MASYASVLERLVARGRGGSSGGGAAMKNMPSAVGLDRTRAVLSRLLKPEDVDSVGNKVVHVVGTNGKGSVAWKTAKTLVQSGICQRVGLYTSPHLFTVRERIRINGELIEKEAFTSLGEEALRVSDADSSYFELVTCMAIAHFARSGCDAVVLEAGMGGKGDATNCLSRTRVAVLTSVALDHVAVLGSTLEDICREKIGVVKEGTQVVLGPGVPYHLDDIVRETCIGNRASSIKRVLPSSTPSGFDDENSYTARAAVREFSMAQQPLEVDQSRPRCRLEQIKDKATGKMIVLDVGHNPAALKYAMETLQAQLRAKVSRPALVFAIAQDKDAKGCLEQLVPAMPWVRIEFATLGNKGRKFSDPATLKTIANSILPSAMQRIDIQMDVRSAVRNLLEDRNVDSVVCCGSHALMAEALAASGNEVTDTDPFDTNERGAKDSVN